MKKSVLSQRIKNEQYLKVFLMGSLTMFIVILPIILFTGGYYIYYGDYNSQQIPFYVHAQDFVKNEGLGWDWYTDLGSNFVGSYSFYLLGSPFFWLTLPFPNAFVVFLMPLLLAVKHGIAALTGYAFIKRFVKSRNAAMIGGMLYAFSGFQLFNIFFNHFQDVTALFPLMLIALEENVNNDRRGFFGITVAVMGILNYFFFAGQAVFVIIYILTRLKAPDFKITWIKFIRIAIEAILGVMAAMVILLPAALGILGNYRINERMYGLDMVTYSDRTRLWHIIQSFFMIPDVPARPNLFSTDGAKWSSIGGYLPVFSMAGVIAFWRSRRKHWSVKLIIVCMICAFIPILNSMFYTFNSSYYARWFYMPILIMAMMTSKAIEDKQTDIKGGIRICGIFMLLMAAIFFLPTKNDKGDVEFFEFANYPEHFWIVWAISMLGLVILWLIDNMRREGKDHLKKALLAVVIGSGVCTASVVYFGVTFGSYPYTYIQNGIYGRDNIQLEEREGEFFRLDISENFDNYPMFWKYPTMRAFQSTVSEGIMEFYPNVGITRDVASRAPIEDYTLRGLFSVKYYFDKLYTDKEKDYKYKIDLPGFEYMNRQNDFYVYENKYYVPMGFAYDYCLPEKETKNHTEKVRERSLLRALVMPDDMAEKYKNVITQLPMDMLIGLDEKTYLSDCNDRKNESCTDFEYDSEGFSANISLDTEKMVFFSVPYDKGWKAYVNGEPAEIVKANYGFMAVKADAGENHITFEYDTPGLTTGFVVSLAGIALLAAYMIISGRRKKYPDDPDYGDYSCSVEMIYLNGKVKEHKGEDR